VYAYLSITGVGCHEDVTKILEICPSEAWNAGDLNPRNGAKRKFMQWRLHSGLDDTHSIDEHVSSIFLVIQAKANLMRNLWLEYDLTLQCVGYYPEGSHGNYFSREVIRQAANLGLGIDLDFYCSEIPEYNNKID
jgi:Domain of unknown function (DUF4279)